jgi:hypothetical protein
MPLVSLAQKADTLLKRDFKPTGIRVGTDLLSLVRIPVDDSFNGWEVSADVDFHRYFLTMEIGQWQRSFTTDEETYANDGSYWRIGVDVNFLKKDPDRNMLFIGARYATGRFDEDLTVMLNDTWNSGTSVYNNTGTKATWAEVTGGLRVKIWKFVWLGYTARYKFGLNTEEKGALKPYDVPGYGGTYKNTTWGFNYQLLIRIPVRKLSVLPEQ